MWKCQWEHEVNGSFWLYHVQRPSTSLFASAVSSISSRQFYGLVECDISVPSHLRASFYEMAPIFKNFEVGREHLGERMLCLARQRDYLSRLSCMLVGASKLRVSGFCCLVSWLAGICSTVSSSPGSISCYNTNEVSCSIRLKRVCLLPEEKEMLTRPRALLRTLQSLLAIPVLATPL